MEKIAPSQFAGGVANGATGGNALEATKADGATMVVSNDMSSPGKSADMEQPASIYGNAEDASG